MFLLIYSIIQEAIAAQLFSATFTAATAIIQIIILALTYQPSSYKPYKPKTKWRKKVKAKCKLLSDKASSAVGNAFEWSCSKLAKIYGKCRKQQFNIPSRTESNSSIFGHQANPLGSETPPCQFRAAVPVLLLDHVQSQEAIRTAS
jgi:hypothetical protein